MHKCNVPNKPASMHYRIPSKREGVVVSSTAVIMNPQDRLLKLEALHN